MNDPGLDAPINDNARKVENEGGEEGNEGTDQAFLNPSRWWFASTAFPLIAGTLGPMASAFNVCALAEHWRVNIPPGGVEEHGIDVPDPPWLLAVNAVSLILAVFANIALLFNMAKRLPFRIAQPITIAGWYASSFILIGLLGAVTTGLKLPEGESRALNQAFYYAIMAAALYFIIATLMVITVWGAHRGHYPKQFELTTSQRTLMLQTLSFLVYLLGGAGVFCRVEQWAYLDAVYWADYTLLTVGTGDYAPKTHLGRGLFFPFAFGGIVILGLVVGSIRSLVLERGKKKLGARMVEKKREAIIKRFSKGKNGKAKLTPIGRDHKVTDDSKSEKERRKEEFHLMRTIQDRAATERKWMSLCISGGAWFILWFIGALVFFKAERNQDWTYFQSLYFAYVSLLTIGFGDFHPDSNSGKPFFVFWSLLAIPTLTILISNMGDTVVKFISDATLYLGEITVLPGQDGFRPNLQRAYNKAFNRGPPEEDAPGMLGEVAKPESGELEAQRKHVKVGQDFLAKQFEDEERGAEKRDALKGDIIGRDVHHYHYLLVREIRDVQKDIGATPAKKYSYDQWAWFLRLIGEDENSTDYHRAAQEQPDRDADGHFAPLQNAQSPSAEEAAGSSSKSSSTRGEDGGQDKSKTQWSWLGARSPLMGESDEAGWVLERLSVTLERELKKERDQQRRASGDNIQEGEGVGGGGEKR
ncbi:Potassium channel [Agyrium rufum]|nr:Potassium channel [Agyrium rufum]